MQRFAEASILLLYAHQQLVNKRIVELAEDIVVSTGTEITEMAQSANEEGDGAPKPIQKTKRTSAYPDPVEDEDIELEETPTIPIPTKKLSREALIFLSSQTADTSIFPLVFTDNLISNNVQMTGVVREYLGFINHIADGMVTRKSFTQSSLQSPIPSAFSPVSFFTRFTRQTSLAVTNESIRRLLDNPVFVQYNLVRNSIRKRLTRLIESIRTSLYTDPNSIDLRLREEAKTLQNAIFADEMKIRTDAMKYRVEKDDIPPKPEYRVDLTTFQDLSEFTFSEPPLLSQHYAIQIARTITSQLPPPFGNHSEAVKVCQSLVDWTGSDLTLRIHTLHLIEQFFPKLKRKELMKVGKHFLRLTYTFDQSMPEREPEVFEALRNFWQNFQEKKNTEPAPEPTHRTTIVNDVDVEDEEEEAQPRTVHQTEMLRDDDDDEHPPSPPKPSKKPKAQSKQAQAKGVRKEVRVLELADDPILEGNDELFEDAAMGH
ncbi:hypothetical protein BLNAU_2361 [Blattamonas nauphoetae]|uniref:Uncharacterized protein n=1 Tax=Blattamonas nauphoetae TaxID=2049346 RepID=A0ABQ9YFM4_9EUKA|nr:hypothetical protein BLNAU_2361 [Blattamonas nauphoetae]